MRTIATGAALALACLLAPTARAQEATTPKAQYDALVAEYKKAMSDFQQLYGAAKDEAERQQIVDTKYPKPETLAPRFRELADKFATDPVAVDCVVWLLQNVRASDEKLFAVLQLHLDSDQLGSACRALQSSAAAGAEPFLRAVLDKSPHHDVQGQACYALAKFLAGRAGLARKLLAGVDGKRLESLEGYYGKGTLAKLRTADPAALEHEGEQVLEQVVAKFADVKSGRGTLGDAATGDLFEMRNLAVGKQAPDIEGEDVDGVKFKLSDYRGQVVFLDFWGFW
jgi:hypothetical protein